LNQSPISRAQLEAAEGVDEDVDEGEAAEEERREGE
jgi:hypothetical protein